MLSKRGCWLWVGFFLALVSLSGCASMDHKSISSFNLFNTYEGALRDFQQGKILEARAKVLGIDEHDEDYVRARRLLSKKIEPARLRLLKHYKRQAGIAASKKQWVKAEHLYRQAALFSLGNASLEKKAAEMKLQIQQLRLNRLIVQRRKEDGAFMRWLSAYQVPSGLDPTDEPFQRTSKELQEELDARVRDAYVEARRYLRRGYPEVAYVEIESYLRFQPDSKMGKKLMKEIKGALPDGLRIPPLASGQTVKKPREALTIPVRVRASDVEQLIRQGRWLEARRYALAYQKNGGKNAETYLRQIETYRLGAARKAFNKGKLAFQREKMDLAVKHWQRAVELDPDNTEYAENLQRARQLQERLLILRQEANE